MLEGVVSPNRLTVKRGVTLDLVDGQCRRSCRMIVSLIVSRYELPDSHLVLDHAVVSVCGRWTVWDFRLSVDEAVLDQADE